MGTADAVDDIDEAVATEVAGIEEETAEALTAVGPDAAEAMHREAMSDEDA